MLFSFRVGLAWPESVVKFCDFQFFKELYRSKKGKGEILSSEKVRERERKH